MVRWRDAVQRPLPVDALLALVLTLATQVELSVGVAAGTLEGPEWAQRGAFALATLAVAGRRVAPLAAAIVCAVGMAVQTPLGAAPAVGGFLALMIVTHAVALRCGRARAVVGLVAVLVGVHLYDVLFWAETSIADVVANAAIFAAIWGLGRGARHWRSRTEQMRERAATAEREQEDRAREAVRHEQARIARELHDIVAHGISVMTLQAGAARQVLGPGPEPVREALLTIEDHGRRSLDEMHRLLGILRRGEDGLAPPSAVPSTDIAELVARTRALGLPVDLRVDGEPGDVAPSLALSVHRIVQEALTNALRHGAREDVQVGLRWAPDAVDIAVRDAGRAGATRPARPTVPASAWWACASASRCSAASCRRARARTADGRCAPGCRASRPWDDRPVIEVVIADDEALVRGGIRMILEAQGDVAVVGEAADGADAVRLVTEHAPDVVLMDVRMPVLDGLEAARRVLAGPSATRVLMLTTFDQDAYVYDALRAGAGGFLLKSVPPEHLVHALRVVAAGEALLDPAITRRLVERFVARPAPGEAGRSVLARLSDREADVLRLIATGMSNVEIAGRLFLSEGTVKTHVNHLLRKLDLRDRVQAVVLAYESGLVTPGGGD